MGRTAVQERNGGRGRWGVMERNGTECSNGTGVRGPRVVGRVWGRGTERSAGTGRGEGEDGWWCGQTEVE